MNQLKLFAGSLLVALLATGCSKSTSTDQLSRAREALKQGDTKSALIHYKNVLQNADQDPKVRLEYADALEKSADFPGAEQQLKRAVELGADKDSTIPRVAAWMLDRNASRDLVRDYQSVDLGNASANADLRAIVALAHLNQGRIADAEKEIFKTKETPPTVGLARAQILGLKGDLNAAKLLTLETRNGLKKAPSSPHHWWVWRGLARLALAFGEGPQAIEDFRAAKLALPSHFGVTGELGETLLSLGKTEEARAELTILKKSAPAYFRTALLEALLRFNEGNVDAAYELAAKVLTRVPDNISASLMSAGIDLNRGNLATAEARLNQILKANPNVVEALRLRASIAAKRGNFALADQLVRTALSRAPDNVDLLLDVAESHMAQGREKEARVTAERALSLSPNSARGLGFLAEVESRGNNKAKASDYFDRAIAVLDREPAAAEPLFRLALRYKQPDKADIIVNQVSKSRPEDPNPLLWRAIAAKEKKNDKEALSHLLQSLDKKKDFYPALAILKSVYPVEGLSKEYEARLRAALAARSKDERIGLDYLAFLRGEGTKPDLVIEAARQLLKDNVESVRLRSELAQILLAANKPGEADQVINQGLSDYPKSPGMQEFAALWAESRGSFGTALERYTKLAQNFPENVVFVQKRAQMLYRDGKKDEAIKVYEQAVRLRPEDEAANRDLAYARYSAGQLANAIKAADDYSALPNHLADGLLLKADLHLAAKNYTDAKKVIEAAQRAGAGDRAIFALIAVLDKQGSSAEADKTLDAWLAKNPKSVQMLSFAAARASGTGDHRKAILHLNTLLSIKPNHPILLNDLAWAQASLKQTGASENARKALEAMPDNTQILDTLAFALKQEGKKDLAINALRQIVAVNPNALQQRLDLVDLLLETNAAPEAKQVLTAVDAAKVSGPQAQRYKSLAAKLP
jgi:putative PEP-CTERM system TPR-repeat lipoprotein